MKISIVIPVFNEEDCIGPLLLEIQDCMTTLPVEDVIVVDDGSDDHTIQNLSEIKKQMPRLRIIRHKVRSGQSCALRTGIAQARGELIVTLDGDGQNNPADITLLFEKYKSESSTGTRIMVAGQRKKRNDTFIRRLSSRVANTVRAAILDDGVKDTGCSLKLFHREDFINLPFFNHIHRFIPAMMKAHDVKIALIDVSHRQRERGVSKYGLWDRLWVGIADLFGVRWLISRTKTPNAVEEL